MRNLRTNKEGGGGVLPGGSGSGRGGRATTTTTTQAAAGGNRAANRAGGPTDPSIRRQRGILILSTRGPLDGDRTGQGRDGEGIHRGLSGASTARRLRLRRVAAAGPAASARACLAGPHGAAPGRPACWAPSLPARWMASPGHGGRSSPSLRRAPLGSPFAPFARFIPTPFAAPWSAGLRELEKASFQVCFRYRARFATPSLAVR